MFQTAKIVSDVLRPTKNGEVQPLTTINVGLDNESLIKLAVLGIALIGINKILNR